jgi:hypothetical protein
LDLIWAEYRYKSTHFRDDVGGLVGLHLHAEPTSGGPSQHVATVTYWDTQGQYFVRSHAELPLFVLEELVRETRAVVGA